MSALVPGPGRPFRIGVISDTHDALSTCAESALAGVDAIVHAGDIGDGSVLELPEAIAPVTAVAGASTYRSDRRCPAIANVLLGGVRVVVAHRIEDVTGPCTDALDGARVVITGHTHVPSIEERDGVLWLNPGSPSAPRQGSVASVAIVEVDEAGAVSARIVPLAY